MRFPLTLAACLAVSAVHAQPARHHAMRENGPPCLTASNALNNALARDTVVGRLDGHEAQDVLDRVNAVGDPTSYRAAAVIVILHQDRATVAMFDACYTGTFSMRLDAFAEVWRAARGEGV